MKYCTLNTHSLLGEDYERKQEVFVDTICEELPDIIALQEVNQGIADDIVTDTLAGYCGTASLKSSNYALSVARMLANKGVPYYWYWEPCKIGYDCYDEGLALFSRHPIKDTEAFYISSTQDYTDWRARKALGISIENAWYYSVHMGWWNADHEPFLTQWKTLMSHVMKHDTETIYLMGDFNALDKKRLESYDTITASWIDLYHQAKVRYGRNTTAEVIDGWKDKAADKGMRIDYIFCNRPVPIKEYRILWDGQSQPTVSDHFGIMIEEGEY